MTRTATATRGEGSITAKGRDAHDVKLIDPVDEGCAALRADSDRYRGNT